jgi:hypothetical protein
MVLRTSNASSCLHESRIITIVDNVLPPSHIVDLRD